jgi:23S rRNA (cytosine1962-C5)-methyltransferase
MYPVITLKRGKEASSGYLHPWIFSGAVETKPDGLEHGALVEVQDGRGETLGVGTFSTHSSIVVRLLAFERAVIDTAWFVARLKAADARRQLLGYGPGTATTGYRVVFGEADGLPGLVLDRYGDVLVMQLSTAGLNLLKGELVEAIEQVFAPRALHEKSDLAIRREEGLAEYAGRVSGTALEAPVEFTEHGLRYLADPVGGQKTGAFLDQKDLRVALRSLAKDRRVLNLFSYAGAHAVAALAGGAESVLNVDISEDALALGARQAELNGFGSGQYRQEAADVFQWLGQEHEEKYDLVIMDPPALIKSAKDAEQGRKAYHFLNRAAMRLVKEGGLFVSSSCSHYFPEDDLAFTLRRASVQAGLRLMPLMTLRQSPDHPVSVYFPESSYLKTLVTVVEKGTPRA